MNWIIEFLVVAAAFWLVSNRMDGITLKRQSTVFAAAAVYIISYAVLKWLLMLLFKILTLGFMFGMGFVAIVLAALGAMYMVTSLLDDYKIDSFPVLAAAVLVIAVVSSILRFLIYFI